MQFLQLYHGMAFGLKKTFFEEWSSLSETSGEYCRCGKFSYLKSLNFRSVILATCSRALTGSRIRPSEGRNMLHWIKLLKCWYPLSDIFLTLSHGLCSTSVFRIRLGIADGLPLPPWLLYPLWNLRFTVRPQVDNSPLNIVSCLKNIIIIFWR